MKPIQPCYFYVNYTGVKEPGKGQVWPLCLECGQTWQNAFMWTGTYGPWEYRCHNPLCPTPGGKVIWDGTTDSTMQ